MSTVKIKDIADVYVGATIRRYVDEENGKKTKVIVQRSIQKGQTITDFEEMSISDKINEKFFTQKGDLLMKTTIPNDVVCVEEDGLIVGERIAIIRLKEDCNNNFMAHQLNSEFIKRQIHKLISSSVIPQISVNDIKELEVKIFDLETQNEYCELLDSINERISVYEELKKADQDLQTGILNKLLGGN